MGEQGLEKDGLTLFTEDGLQLGNILEYGY